MKATKKNKSATRMEKFARRMAEEMEVFDAVANVAISASAISKRKKYWALYAVNDLYRIKLLVEAAFQRAVFEDGEK